MKGGGELGLEIGGSGDGGIYRHVENDARPISMNINVPGTPNTPRFGQKLNA